MSGGGVTGATGVTFSASALVEWALVVLQLVERDINPLKGSQLPILLIHFIPFSLTFSFLAFIRADSAIIFKCKRGST